MGSQFPTIAFQIGGRGAFVRLKSSDEVARHIREGSLTAAHWVFVYRGETATEVRAGEVHELVDIFEEVTGVSHAKTPKKSKAVAAPKAKQEVSKGPSKTAQQATLPLVHPKGSTDYDRDLDNAAVTVPPPRAPQPPASPPPVVTPTTYWRSGLRLPKIKELQTALGARYMAPDGKTFATRDLALDYATGGAYQRETGGAEVVSSFSPNAQPSPPPPQVAPDLPLPGPPDLSSRVKAFGIMVAIVAVLYLMGRCSQSTGPDPIPPIDQPVPSSLPADNINIAEPRSGPAPISAEEIAESATHYVVRETNVRAEPTGQSRSIALLPRGETVRAVLVPGQDAQYTWLKITSGPNAGYFIAASNLSDQSRPSLDTSISGRMTVIQGMPIYAEPDRISRVLDNASPGSTLSVIGMTSNGMAELSLRGGGIGYIDSEALSSGFDGDEPSIQAPGSRESPAPVQSPSQQAPYEPTPSYVPPSQAQRPRPVRGTPAVSDADYPRRSLDRGESGVVGYVATVGADGRVISCRVSSSSGHSALDGQTCRLVRARARFYPATDRNGEPMTGVYDGTMNWRLD